MNEVDAFFIKTKDTLGFVVAKIRAHIHQNLQLLFRSKISMKIQRNSPYLGNWLYWILLAYHFIPYKSEPIMGYRKVLCSEMLDVSMFDFDEYGPKTPDWHSNQMSTSLLFVLVTPKIIIIYHRKSILDGPRSLLSTLSGLITTWHKSW